MPVGSLRLGNDPGFRYGRSLQRRRSNNECRWWGRVVEPRARHEDLLPQRVWTLRNDGHDAALDLKALPGIGGGIVLTGGRGAAQDAAVALHVQAELVGATSRDYGRRAVVSWVVG
jgi:hypothetical protein